MTLPPAFPLPQPAPAPLPAATRLAYVLRHFHLAYDSVPEVSIGYEETAVVRLEDASGGFFSGQAPYPPAPQWRDWCGTRLPFFFSPPVEAPLLHLPAGRAFIGPDLISAAFYLLSGWQEYFSAERDQHGRFPYAASVQKQYGFVTLPLVNYYFDVLRAAVEHVTGQPLRPRRWGPAQAAFAGFITHDIDTIHGGWGTRIRSQLHQGHLPRVVQTLLYKAAGRPSPWNNLEEVQEATTKQGAPSTFFMLGSQQPASNGTLNADYDLTAASMAARLRKLAARGAEIASHASYGTATTPGRLQAERQRYGLPAPTGNRFHYLCWEPRITPQLVAGAGFRYDSTLGFAEHFGFRNSYCHPFFPFDFEQGQALAFLELPLNVMDATLHHPNYLQLSAPQIMPALQPLFAEIEKFGGLTTLLWHNDHFDPANDVTGPRQFAEIMTHLQQRGAAFLTGSQIVAEVWTC
ncbi:DUF7033 domain-containing protein [Hymenobacter saemangeumensis]